jgi:hypothetical protein
MAEVARVDERTWAKDVAQVLETNLRQQADFQNVRAETEQPLRYSAAIMAMHPIEGQTGTFSEFFQPTDTEFTTDILIWETVPHVHGQGWIPRVVVECKIRSVTTHDALVYGAKAEKHRTVFPYLRYGLLVGEMPSVPTRVPLHGDRFDFMVAWPPTEGLLPPDLLSEFAHLIGEEIRASRTLENMIKDRRGGNRTRYRVFHRPLIVKEA